MGQEGKPGMIVDTDYDSYVIYYKCVDEEDGMRHEVAGISVRDPSMSEDEIQKLLDLASEKIEVP